VLAARRSTGALDVELSDHPVETSASDPSSPSRRWRYIWVDNRIRRLWRFTRIWPKHEADVFWYSLAFAGGIDYVLVGFDRNRSCVRGDTAGSRARHG